MIFLPSSRRHLLSAVTILALILIWRSSSRVPTSISSLVLHQPKAPPIGIHVPLSDLKHQILPLANTSASHLSPPSQYFYGWGRNAHSKTSNGTFEEALWSQPILNPQLEVLWQCPLRANRFTNHIRLPNIMQNISQVPPRPVKLETRVFWNPTIIALPYWSENQYLVVSRIVTDGNHQENVICEANICYTGASDNARLGEKPCTDEDHRYLGPSGGLRCATPSERLSVPPTPAERCEGKFGTYVDIPGFHDPRIFYSGKGEPLMMVNTQSRYACFGLWLIDLRSLNHHLPSLLSSSPKHLSLGPLKSYPTLTELTRNPPSTRSPIEKNWMLFYPESGETFIHYDISNPNYPLRGRTFAKVIGDGLTTTNLTDPLELPCIPDIPANEPDEVKRGGTWHQATNALRLVLCDRADKTCTRTPDNTVFFAIIHRKHPNFLHLPLRYERYFIVWGARPPYSMYGISQHPILLANETASGWRMDENWDDDPANAAVVAAHKGRDGANSTDPHGGKRYWAYFTYTVSIAWAWGREVEVAEMNVGYLDDEVVLAIGIDDKAQGMARVKARDLLQCMRACPGRERFGGKEQQV
ncbi:hypothetical protein MMC32_002736 [Xylographa parallela]|nr:hypothetical protein [Xylographa parallela]